MKILPTQIGAVYLRVSTDQQDAVRQRESTSEWLGRHGALVKPDYVFEDIGWSRADAAKRPRFQSMLADVQAGFIHWIVVDRPDRFGAKDKFEAFHYLHLLREAGCKLYTVDDRELTSGDTASALITHLDFDQSERELREKSVRTLTGKVEFAKRSEWLGGRIPYGMDVAAFRLSDDADLVEQWRVKIIRRDLKVKLSQSGEERQYTGTRNFPASENDEILQLRPSQDESKLEIIRWVHETFLTQSTTPGTLARQLAERGVDAPPYSDSWQRHHITEILTNPCYMGRPAWNRKTVGDYTEWLSGRRIEKVPGSRKKYHDRPDWVMAEQPIYRPIVSVETWERSQIKMEAMPKRPRSSRPQNYTYSDLVFCGDCGAKMHGQAMSTGRKQKTRVLTYLCGTYNNWRGPKSSGNSCQCKARRIRQSELDILVQSFLSDTLPHVVSIAESYQSRNPRDLTQAIKLAVEAHKQMRDRVGADFAQLTSAMTGGDSTMVLDLPDFETDGRRFVPEWDTKELEQIYRWKFDDEKDDLEARRVDLQTVQEELIETIKKIPISAGRALARVQRELDEVETSLAAVEDRLVNAADRFKDAEADWNRLQDNWNRAIEHLASEGAARKQAEAIRAVIEKIDVRFRSTGRRKPALEVQSVHITPKDAKDCVGSGTSLLAKRSRSAF